MAYPVRSGNPQDERAIHQLILRVGRMALNEYKPGTTFTGRMARTIGEAGPVRSLAVRQGLRGAARVREGRDGAPIGATR
jgi:hypothetical protein